MGSEAKDRQLDKAPAVAAEAPVVLRGLAPVTGPQTQLLVLGSFPGGVSLVRGQYYAHPQNQFWKILQALWPQHPQPAVDDYAGRCAWLLERRLGVWDVYASCARAGSLDSKIRNARMNDFAALKARAPSLVAIAHNGAESFRHARHTAALGVPVMRLPSTSPANASWSFERKLGSWREAFAAHGLLA
jgi:TDG/mug DNA glycosylase family protein